MMAFKNLTEMEQLYGRSSIENRNERKDKMFGFGLMKKMKYFKKWIYRRT